MKVWVAPVASTASLTVSKTGSPWAVFCPPLPGVTPPTRLVPYAAMRPVWYEPSAPVMPWTITLLFLSKKIDIVPYPFASAKRTASRAPSSIVSTGVMPASARMRRPSSSFVPVKRMTSGIFRDAVVAIASTTPRATSSPRVMPPKMLTKSTRAPVLFTTSS